MIGTLKRNWNSRTFRLAVGGILLAVGGALAEQIDWMTALLGVVSAAQAIFARDKAARSDETIAALHAKLGSAASRATLANPN